MLRETLTRQLDNDPDFNWRGTSVTRIENLSDIVFAISLGFLVASTPGELSLTGLQAHLMNIVPVALAFSLLLSIWNSHFIYFRRYALADTYIVFLNSTLLLFILFIAYPLRFIFDSLFAWIIGSLTDDWSRMDVMGIYDYRQAGIIMGYFGAGFAIVQAILSRMYAHALRKADLLELDPKERIITQRSVWNANGEMLIGAMVGVLAAFTPAGAFAGFGMWLIQPLNFAVSKLVKIKPDADEVSSEARPR